MNQNKSNIGNFSLQHDTDTERALISSLICEPTAISEVATILTEEMFYTESFGIIYRHIKKLYDQFEKPDLITITRSLTQAGDLDKVGGAYAIVELSTIATSSANIGRYALILRQLYTARQLAMFGADIMQKSCDPTSDIDDVLNDADKQLSTIATGATQNAHIKRISTAVAQSIESYEKRKGGLKTGIKTGLKEVDYVTGGFKPGQLIILAGRPAMGKTAVLLHLAKSAGAEGNNVLIFSLEMGSISLTDRLILSFTNIDPQRFRQGYLTQDEEAQLLEAGQYLSQYPISIDDTAGMTIQKIKAIARDNNRKGKCDIVFIDYLQLIDMRSENKSYNREQEVSQTSRACKLMAKELGIPVVLLSQLSRAVETRADKTPILSDLRESGAIEQDADVVMLIHRPEYYDNKEQKGLGILRIAKQRDGMTGDIDFSYNESLTQISDYKQRF